MQQGLRRNNSENSGSEFLEPDVEPFWLDPAIYCVR